MPVLEMIGAYEVVEKIAEGGMGSVYKARDKESSQLVAIKVLPPHLAKNPVLLKRFEQEYNAAKLLNNPNIVRALGFGYTGESPYLVMEYVEGESLGDRLEREKRIPEDEAIDIISQVAQGLHKAHKQGLIHRDVKPDNILLMHDGQVKLADLGLVKEMETDLNLTRTGRGLGTPHFMAPEQFRNAKNADVRCDIYSLAATLYMMVTGVLPFKSLGPLEAWMKKVENKITAPRDIDPAISERVDWAIRRAMHSDPDQRPGSCREFIEDLTGRSTRKLATPTTETDETVWYLLYHDEEGVLHTVTATTESIRRSLKDGHLGDASNIRASRLKTGPFDSLRNHPEFRDVILATVLTAPPPQAAARNTSKPSAAKSPSPYSSQPAPQQASAPEREPPLQTLQPQPISPLAPKIHMERMGKNEPSAEQGRFLLFLIIALLAGAGGFFLFSLLFH